MEKRVAIITGAARGIGKAVAERLARDGFFVAIADLDEEAARTACAESGIAGMAVGLDATNLISVHRTVNKVLEQAGRIDVLVNNAGIVGTVASITDLPEEEWRRVIATNLDSMFLCSKAVLPHMLERGSGRIVNIASISGKEGNPNMVAYSASKAGVIGFTKALAKEVATRGVYVNCVTPAVIETEMMRQVTQETLNYLVSKIPMGRVGQPEEVAALVAWLASDECSFSTGAVFDASGGRATY